MVDRTTGESRRIVRLVERALVALEQSGETGLAELLRSHPEEASVVRARLQVLAQSGLTETRPAPQSPPGKLGEFVPLERLGEGGMGVVWRAEQPSLGRTVALKVIRPEYLWFEGARERFRREAEAVARLRHPGIVPIHAFGEEGGVPYLAFELVEGLALDRVLSALAGADPASLPARRALEVIAAHDKRGGVGGEAPRLFAAAWLEAAVSIARAVGEALAHAHTRGVLHRDLKPSNVMLTRDGDVRLLDFGVASAEGSTRVTREGSAPGSLAYMAPELLDGTQARADVRSEVYSLGVLLYELLALQAPFEGGSAERVRARILSGEIQSLQRLHRGLPWELVAICEHAIERDPARRYADVQELLEDLRRYLAHEPILARKSGVLRKSWRFAQRHPVSVTVTALLAALVIAIPTAIAVQQSRDAAREREASARIGEERNRANEAAARATEARLHANEERERAEASLRDLLKGIDRMLVQVGSLELRDAPRSDAVRCRLMDEACALLAELASREGDDAEIAFALVRARVRRAEVLVRIGQVEIAGPAVEEAVESCEALLLTQPENTDLVFLASIARSSMAARARLRGEASTARESTAKGIEHLERLCALRPESAGYATELGQRYQDLALELGLEQHAEAAFEAYERAEAEFARALKLEPQAPLHAYRGVGRINRASLLANLSRRNADRKREALEMAQTALDDVEVALARDPDSADLRSDGSRAWQLVCVLADELGDRELELEGRERAVELARWCAERFPARSSYRLELAEACRGWAKSLQKQGEDDQARDLLEEAQEHAARVPPSNDVEREQVLCNIYLDLARDAASTEQEIEHLSAAFALRKQLLGVSYERRRNLLMVAETGMRLARAWAGLDDDARTAETAAETLDASLELVKLDPSFRKPCVDLCTMLLDAETRARGVEPSLEHLLHAHAVLQFARRELVDASRPAALLESAKYREFLESLP